MLIDAKKKFTAILDEYSPIDESKTSFPRDAHLTDLEKTEHRYRNLQDTLSLKLDDLANTQDILCHFRKNTGSGTCHCEFIYRSLQRAVCNIANFKHFEAPHLFADFYLKKGSSLYEQHRFEEAFCCWENVLHNDPTNENVLWKLHQAVEQGQKHSGLADLLLKRYKLEFVSSFGHSHIKKPRNLLVLNDRKMILVTDSDGNNVCKFDVNGQYIDDFSFDFKNPQAMFRDDQGNVWICDFGNSRIVATNSLEELIEEIQIREVVGDRLATCHPVHGCMLGPTVYLILKDISQTRANIISFDKTATRTSLHVFPPGKLQAPYFIRLYDNQVYIGETDPAGIYLLDTRENCIREMNQFMLPSPLLGFAKDDDIFFVNAGEYLFKISKDELIFVADVRELSGLRSAIHNSVDLWIHDGNRTIFMLDASQFCLHRFEV